MVKYNNSNINDWNFDTSNIIKVYRNNAVVYYKVETSGSTPSYKVCYAVVNDISQYQETEFVDVYDKATNKWYKLNNLNQYEKYGVYGEGRSITYYDGKLTIDDGYEYQYGNNQWNNVGEVSGDSKTSGFTIEDIGSKLTTMPSDGDICVISYYRNDNPRNPEYMMSYQSRSGQNYASNLSRHGITTVDSSTVIDAAAWVFEKTSSADTYYIKNLYNEQYWSYQSRSSSTSFYLVNSSSKTPIKLFTPTCYSNTFGFAEQKSGGNVVFGGYGLNQLYSYTYLLNWWNDVGSDVCSFFSSDGNSDFYLYKLNSDLHDYPLYYDEKQAPLDNLTFSTMADAVSYALNNCVWFGMTSTINNTDYIFCDNYEWLTKYDYATVTGDYLCISGDKYTKVEKMQRTPDGSFAGTGDYSAGTMIESASTDCMACQVKFCGTDANRNEVTIDGNDTTLINAELNAALSYCLVEGTVGVKTTTIGQYAFQYATIVSQLSALTISDSVTTIEHEAFMECKELTTITIPASVTQIDFWAFTRLTGLQEVIFEGTTPPNFTNLHYGVFHDYCPPVIYVPDSALSAYRNISGAVWTNKSWDVNIIQPISNRQ